MSINANIKTLLKNHLNTSPIYSQDPLFDLSLIVNNSEEILLVIDEQYQVIMCNQVVVEKLKRLFGVELETGKSFFDLLNDFPKETVKELYQKTLSGQTTEFEYAIEFSGTGSQYCHFLHKPARNFDDEIIGIIVIVTNITEKKKAYEALAEIEQRWRFALEGSNQGVWDWNMETDEVYFSPAWKRMLGYNENEIANKNSEWENLIHPDDKEKMLKHIDKHSQAQSPYYETEYRLKAKEGGYRWILSRGMITSYTSDGKPVRMIGTHTDITERRKIEETYKLLFYNSPMPMWTCDKKTLSFLNVNNAAIQHYGYTREEFLRMSILDICCEQDKEKAEQEIKAENKKCFAGQPFWRHRKKNGEVISVNLAVELLGDNSGARCLVIVEDITEKIHAEEKLKASEQQYKALFKNNPLPSFIYDIETLKFLEVNEAAIEHFGFTAKEFHHKTVSEIILPAEAEKLKEFIRRNKKRVTKDSSWKFINKEGDQIIGEVSAGPFLYNGVNARLVVVNDITEKIKTEQELEDANLRFQLVNKATSDAIWDWDLVAGDIKWNDGLYNLFGWSPQQEPINKWKELIHPDDRERIQKTVTDHINDKSQILWRQEYWFKKADGNYSYVLDRGYIIRNSEGQPIRMIGSMQDISEIKLKEKQLLQSTERFHFVLQATSDVIWDWDVTTGEIFISENYHRTFGWEISREGTIFFRDAMDRIHPEDREKVTQSLQAALQDAAKTLWEEEFRYLKADGSFAYVIDRGFISRNETGLPIRMVGALQDISDRKYQEELQSLELRVFEVSAVPGIQFNNVLKTLINGYENLHPGMQASICLLGLNDEVEILAPKLAKEHIRQLRYFIEKQKNKLLTKQEHQKNFIISTVDSDDWKYGIDAANFYNWKISWSVPVYHHSGELLAFINVFLDHLRNPSDPEHNTLIRVRNLLRILMVNHLSLEQIRVSNERYNNMLRATHDLVWDWNLETGTFYRNKEGLRKVYGIEDEKSIQNVYSWMERIHPGDHIKVQKVINDILHATDQDTFDVEYRFKRDDGSYSFIFDRGVIVRNKEGKPLRMIGAAQNVTDRKRLEQELLQQELEKQKFISQATIDTQEQERREIGKELHDNVNQVLTTTKLYLDLSLSSPDLKDELIKKSSKNIIYVINEIRQLSRSLMDPSIGDLGLLDSINDLVDNINITRKLHVSLSASPDLEQYLDESQKLMVFRVIQEAMNNTIKYAQATAVQLSIKKNGDNLELLIADDGKGFDIETVKKGAGLKNIQNRVYLTGGKLQIQSAPTQGCKIIINFPINHLKPK